MPKLSEAQQRLIELCERARDTVGDPTPLNEFTIRLTEEPTAIRRRAAGTALSKLLLLPEDSFSIKGDYPEISQTVGSSALQAVGLVVYKSSWRGHDRTVPKAKRPIESLYDLSLRFVYDSDGYVHEEVGMDTATSRIDSIPTMIGHVWAMAYAETGYEGHNFRSHQPNDDEALEAIALFDELFTHEQPRLQAQD